MTIFGKVPNTDSDAEDYADVYADADADDQQMNRCLYKQMS